MSQKGGREEQRLAERLERVHEKILGNSDSFDEVEAGADHESLADAAGLLKLIQLVKQNSSTPDLDALASRETRAHLDASTQKPETLEALSDDDISDGFLPSRVGRFEIRESIAQGGFGVVLRGFDPDLNRQVAVKIPRLESLISSDARRRFVTEAKAAAALSHPQIVTVYESGQAGPICYLACELIEGPTLAQWLRNRGKPLEPEHAVALVRALADALQHAHERGVVHRDIKPANILLAADGANIDETQLAQVATIGDFGLAKLLETDQANTRTGSLLGTPAYMSPEQTRGEAASASPATDIYALGVLLYELLTGKTPFARGGLVETITAIQMEEPVRPGKHNPSVSRDLDAIVQKCLDKRPERRYTTAFALQRDLGNLADGVPVSVRPVGNLERTVRWSRRNPVLATVSGLLITTLVVGLITVTTLWLSSDRNLRLVKQRESQLQIKSTQLTAAIDRLFYSLATSEELQNESAENLRKTLLAEANQFYEVFLLQEPDDDELRLQYAHSLFRLGQINFILGEIDNGLQLGERAIEQVSRLDNRSSMVVDLGQWYVFVANCHSHAGRPAEAEAAFEKALEFVDLNSEPHGVMEMLPARASILAHRAEFLLTEGKISEARRVAEEISLIWEILETSGDDQILYHNDRALSMGTAMYVMGDCLREEGEFARAAKEYEKAVAILETLIRRIPESSGVAYRIGRCLWGLGVVAAHEKRFEIARDYYRAGREIVLPVCDKHPLIESFRWLASNLHYSLAATEMSTGNYAEVEKHLLAGIEFDEQMLEDFPQLNGKLYNSLGNSYNLLYAACDQWDQRHEEDAKAALTTAIDFTSRAIDERPEWTLPRMTLARAEMNMGNIFFRKKDFANAAIWYEKSLARNDALLEDEPDWSDVRNSNAGLLVNLILNHQSLEEFNKSLVYCERFVDEYPEHPLFQRVRLQGILVTAQSDRYEEAMRELTGFVDSLQNPSKLSIPAAEIAAKIIELESVKDVPERVEDLEDLAVHSLKKGLPEDESARQAYLDEIYNNANLQSYADLIEH